MAKFPPNHHIPDNLSINEKIITEAVRNFGTPLYLYDAGVMNENYKLLKSVLPDNIVIYYSLKANPNIHIADVFVKSGARLEAASEGELIAALHTGISPNNIIFVSPGKTCREMEKAVDLELGSIVVESGEQLMLLQRIASSAGKRIKTALRLNLGKSSGNISMSGVTQFGMEKEKALDILKRRNDYCGLELNGIHSYFGSGILDPEDILENIRAILEAAHQLEYESGIRFNFIDMGGGFGIPYYENENKADWQKLKEPMEEIINDYLCKHDAKNMVFAVESGRFLVGNSGMLVTSVTDIKTNAGKKYVILDGGTNILTYNDRYGHRIPPIRVITGSQAQIITATLCGPLCAPTDRLAVDAEIPLPEIGDRVVFYLAGAYGLSAAPGLFLSHGYPPEVLWNGKDLKLIRRSLTVDFLLELQRGAQIQTI